MQCFPENVILLLFGECVLEKNKMKVLLPIGNIFERYGHLSIIFYKKLIFYILTKNRFLFSKKKNKRKNAQTAKCYKIFRKSILTTFKSTCDDVISFAKIAKKSHDAISLDELFIFIFLAKLLDYDEVYLQIKFESHCCCN